MIRAALLEIRPMIRVVRGSVRSLSRFAASLVLIGFFLPASASAAATSAEALAHFTAASAAFDAQDFSRARALFEQAQAAGMDGPAIHYNIGSAAYRGGDLPRAERAFREVASTPSMAALAYYNLGLVTLQLRDERQAREWFERAVHDPSVNERVKTLSLQRLAELPEPRAPGTWSIYTRGGAGYDDNVALRSGFIDSTGTGAADSFWEIYFAGAYSNGPWRVDGGGSMLEYTSLDEFSQNSLFLGGSRGFRPGKWYLELGAYGSQFTLGGEVFEQDVSVATRATRAFYGGSRLRAQLRATSVAGKNSFEGMTGDRMELGLFYDKGWRSWYFTAHTRTEINDSEDPVFESRWIQLGAEARYALSPLWGFSAGAALRRTQHADQIDAQGENLGSWDDNRATLQVGITRTLWRQAQLFVRYEMERNDSPVEGYDYDRNRFGASVEWWY